MLEPGAKTSTQLPSLEFDGREQFGRRPGCCGWGTSGDVAGAVGAVGRPVARTPTASRQRATSGAWSTSGAAEVVEDQQRVVEAVQRD